MLLSMVSGDMYGTLKPLRKILYCGCLTLMIVQNCKLSDLLELEFFLYQQTPLHVAAREGCDYTVKCLSKLPDIKYLGLQLLCFDITHCLIPVVLLI